MTPKQALVLVICFIVYLLDGFDIVIIAYTAPAISKDWGISSDELGVLFSAGLLGMAMGAMLLSPMADLYGRKSVVTCMLFVVGVSTIGVVFSRTVIQLVTLRFIAGLGLGVIFASLAPLASEYSPLRYRTLLLAVLISGASLGPVVGGMVTAPIIDTQGWQTVFMWAGGLTILTGVLMFFLVPESMTFIIKREPKGALARVKRILLYLGHDTIEKLPPVDLSARQESASIKSLLLPGRWVMTLRLWTTFLFTYAANYFLVSWLPQILVQAGLTQAVAIQAVVVGSVGSLAGTVFFGWIGCWLALNRVVATALLLGSLAFVVLGILIRRIDSTGVDWLFWIVLFIQGFVTSGAFSNLYSVVMAIYPAQVRSTGIGWATGLGRTGAVVSPVIAGALLTGGIPLPSLLYFFAGFYVIASACVYFAVMQEI